MSEEQWTCKKHCEGEWYVYKGEEIISSTDNEIDANSFCEEHNASIQRVLEKKEAVTRNTAQCQNEAQQLRKLIARQAQILRNVGFPGEADGLERILCAVPSTSEHDGQPECASFNPKSESISNQGRAQ